MKKINSILLILAAVAGFTNCTKTELVENKEAGNGGTVVYATTDAVTKTTLSDDYNVLWSTGDQIKFVKDDATGLTYTFTLDTGSGSSSGTFKCTETPSDGTYIVYYPASYDGTNWPAQTYVSSTDISGAPMKATATVSGGTVSDLTFKNEGGILRYTVKGDKTIKSINVKSGSTLDVTLDCGDGVALTSEGTVFNIALPEGTYSNATLTFTATDNTLAILKASTFKVTKNVVSLATFEASELSFVAPPVLPDGALSGVFTVADDGAGNIKKVCFSKGNLWVDTIGSTPVYDFETNQYEISSTWNPSHISNFYWSNTDSKAYSKSYNGSTGNVLFTNATESTPKADFTVNGMKGFWRTLSQAEWQYLLGHHTYKYVSVNGKHGIAIAPDGFSVTIADSYDDATTWATAEAAGLVFLPNTGFRDGDPDSDSDGTIISEGNISCIYWTSTAAPDDEDYNKMAYRMFFQWDDSKPEGSKLITDFDTAGYRYWAVGIRLVTDVK